MNMRCWYSLVFALLANSVFAVEFNCQKIIEDTPTYLHCSNKINSYPVPIHFFYPKNLDTNKPVNLNLHFHGHNLEGYNHFYKTDVAGFGYGDFGAFLIQSNSNSIFLVPESFGNCKTYDEVFKIDSQAINIISEIQILNEFKVNTLSFSGHSGAYRVLRKIFSIPELESKIGNKIIGVGLFDATYSEVNSIVNFAAMNSGFLFFDSFVDGEKGTASEISINLMKKYSSNTNFIFRPTASTKDSVLDQHFGLLKKHGVQEFLEKLNSTN